MTRFWKPTRIKRIDRSMSVVHLLRVCHVDERRFHRSNVKCFALFAHTMCFILKVRLQFGKLHRTKSVLQRHSEAKNERLTTRL